MSFNERNNATLTYSNYEATDLGFPKFPGKIFHGIKEKVARDWNDITEVGSAAKEKVSNWFTTGFHKLREKITPFAVQVESDAKRAINKIHAVADPQWGLYRRADTTLSPELASRIRRLASGNQELVDNVRNIQSQILAFKSLETVTRSQKQAFESLIVRLERLNYTARNTAGTADQVDLWLTRAMANIGSRDFLSNAKETTINDPLSLTDQTKGGDRFSVQDVKDWFGNRGEDARDLLNRMSSPRPSAPIPLPLPGSGAPLPPHNPRRASNKARRAILLGTPLVLVAVGGILAYTLHQQRSRENNSHPAITKLQTVSAVDLGMEAPVLPGNIDQSKYNEWKDAVTSKGSRTYKFQKTGNQDLQEYSVFGKAKVIAINAMLSNDDLYQRILKDPRVRDDIKAIIKELRPESGPRKTADQNDPRQAGLFEMFSGTNPNNQAFTSEYDLYCDITSRTMIEDTLGARNVKKVEDPNNPFYERLDPSTNQLDMKFDAKVGDGLLYVPDFAIVEGSDTGYSRD